MPAIDLFASYGIEKDSDIGLVATKAYEIRGARTREEARRSMTSGSGSMSSLAKQGGNSHQSSTLDTKTQNGNPRGNNGVVVVIPRISKKREYVSFLEDYYVKEVIRQKNNVNGEHWYEVRLGDDETVQV